MIESVTTDIHPMSFIEGQESQVEMPFVKNYLKNSHFTFAWRTHSVNEMVFVTLGNL